MTYQELLEKHGSIRKAASVANLTKSKFMVAYKKELGLCTGTTGCKNPCEPDRTRCKEHLRYAVTTRDPEKRKLYMDSWNDVNRDEKNEKQREYQKDNLDRFRQGNRKYLKTTRGKVIHKEKRARRRAAKLQATPAWVDRLGLLDVYENCPPEHHVDHIIPLQSTEVCGLHVPWNLQYLTAFDNASKSDEFDGTYANDSWRKA